MRHYGEKFLSVVMLLVAVLAAVPEARAITDQEMEHARAVAAKLYLRWANNGSDYLDPLEPKTLGELEGKLKEKEKENIKAFKSVAVPGDYAKWDKEKAVTYWSETFFKSSGLSEQGRGARSQVKKKLQTLTFTSPSENASPTTGATQEQGPELPSAAPASEEPAAAAAEAPEAAIPSAEEIVEQTEATDSLAGAVTDMVATAPEKQGGSNSWMYIVALVVLVGIVVWLVIFASRTMQNSAKAASEADDDQESSSRLSAASQVSSAVKSVDDSSALRPKVRQQPLAVGEEDAEESESILRDRYSRRLAGKDTEIHELQRQVRDLRDENLRLADENSRLSSDLSMARRELEALRSRAAAEVVPEVSAPVAPRSEEVPVTRTRVTPPASASATPTRDIYLGRVNAKGIFVRADRKPIEGKTVFVLSTSDSYTGTYRVLQMEETIDMALGNPEYYLGGGCVAANLLDTRDAEGICNVSSGTAIFEDGCWRVLRKAKIAYE